jgi:uncharacterized protein (DUF952 family)
MVWKKLSDETPIAVKSGNWDGLKSDTLLLATEDEKIHVGVMYEGCMDGSHFRNFYDEISDYEIENVVYWSYVPPLF